MNEIEIKARLKDKERVLSFLKDAGAEFLGIKHQKDIAFWPNNVVSKDHLLGRNYIRIREQESNGVKKILFTLKQPQTNPADCIEHELEVKEDGINQLKSLILTLGYYEFIKIEKTRTTYKLKDIEICLDDVKDLGSFIELEKFAPSGDAEKVQGELHNLLKSFGVEESEHTFDGYDMLLDRIRE